MTTRPTHKLTPSMEDVHRILNIFTSSPVEHISRPLQRTKSSTQLCSSPSYRKSIQSTIKKCTSPTTPHMPNHLFHIPVWPRSSRPHPKPRRFTFAPRHIAKHDDNLLEPNPASFHGSWGRQPSVELHLPITARAFECDEIDDNMSNISLSPATVGNTLSPMSAAIEALTNAATMLNVSSTTAPIPAKPVEQPAKPIQQTVATPTADTNTTPIPPARPLTPTTTAIASIPAVIPAIPSPIIESDTPPLTPMKYIALPHSPPPTLPPNSPTPVIIHIPASPSPAHTRVPPCTPMNPIPMHHARTSHILNRIGIKSSHDKSLPPLHYQTPYQSHTPHYQSHTPLHCLCATSPCSHIIDINTTHGYLYPSPTYSELSSFRSNIPSPIVSEHIHTTPTHSRSSSRLIYTTPTHSRSSSRCNDTPTHAVYPSSWFSWRGRSMSMDACSPHGTSIQSF